MFTITAMATNHSESLKKLFSETLSILASALGKLNADSIQKKFAKAFRLNESDLTPYVLSVLEDLSDGDLGPYVFELVEDDHQKTILDISNHTIFVGTDIINTTSPRNAVTLLIRLIGEDLYRSITGIDPQGFQSELFANLVFPSWSDISNAQQDSSKIKSHDLIQSSDDDSKWSSPRSGRKTYVAFEQSDQITKGQHQRSYTSPSMPSFSGWCATLLGLYLIGTGGFNIAKLSEASGSAQEQTNQIVKQVGVDPNVYTVVIIISYIVGAPIFLGSALLALGSIARSSKKLHR